MKVEGSTKIKKKIVESKEKKPKLDGGNGSSVVLEISHSVSNIIDCEHG